MKLDMDKIIFESSSEIVAIITALEDSKDKDNEVVQALIGKLEVMYMNW